MKFVLGILGLSVGYALIYYGVTLFRSYDSGSGHAFGIPLAVLLGFRSIYNTDPDPYANPPFQFAPQTLYKGASGGTSGSGTGGTTLA